ncbi:MAG: sulfatase-like hydrolase/transferase [Deltaproteobacteria bacterium]|nr:sulfatase-like hydrolase/transferase [Deltaproteobacteria bacterium]
MTTPIAVVLAAAITAAPPPRPPNILIISLDTVRADVVPGFGGDAALSPTLTAWVRESTRFADALTVAPLTVPAHASLLTGRYPAQHGLRDHRAHPEVTVPDSLVAKAKARGFATAAFISAAPLNGLGKKLGFDHVDLPGVVEPRAALETTDHALAWLAAQPDRTPLLAWVHYFDAHYPYDPPQVTWRRCPMAARDAAIDLVRHGGVLDCQELRPKTVPQAWWRPCLWDLYESEVAAIDRQLARLRPAMGRHGPYIWVIIGDHGDCIAEEGMHARHATSLAECALRIPLAIGSTLRPPVAAARRDPVSTIDVAATVAGLAGLAPTGTDGVDLFAGEAPASRTRYVEGAGINMPGCQEPVAGAWRGDTKVVFYPTTGEWSAWRRQRGVLREITRFGDLGVEGERLWLDVVRRPPPPTGVLGLPGGAVSAEEQRTQEALHALGYAQ